MALLRSPYGRGTMIATGMVKPLAERGFQVVIQSVRGTFGSAGVFEPMRNERADGLATVEWITKQPWFGGSIVLTGESQEGRGALLRMITLEKKVARVLRTLPLGDADVAATTAVGRMKPQVKPSAPSGVWFQDIGMACRRQGLEPRTRGSRVRRRAERGRRPQGRPAPGGYSSGTEPLMVVPAPGTESQRTVPPIAPSRSAMFV